MKNFWILSFGFLLAGCASPPVAHRPFVEPEYGMSKQELLEHFGPPESIVIYEKPNKTRIEFDTYVRGSGPSGQKVPVGLVDEKVIGWGRTFYEDHVSLDDIRIK